MNFLAHAYLAMGSQPLLIGNFIADFVKGNQINNYEDDIAEGIRMHRKVDEFTDNHPVFKRSRLRIVHKYRHYSGVIIDLYYDHFLAKNWDDYSDVPLNVFTRFFYEVIKDYKDILPERAARMLPYMINNNWLLGYASIEGIDRSLKGLATRTDHTSGMEHASEDLVKKYDSFESDFREYFPEVINFIRN